MLDYTVAFMLFANCVPVKGAKRSIICDLQRDHFEYIPNSMYDFVLDNNGKSIREIVDFYGSENEEIVVEYLEFLFQSEFAFTCDESEVNLFPKLEIDEYFSPEVIHNSIIDSDDTSDHDYGLIFSQLDDLGCQSVQLRCFAAIEISELVEIVGHSNNTCITNIEILLPYSVEQDLIRKLDALTARFNRISSITVHSIPESKIAEVNSVEFVNTAMSDLLLTVQKITSSNHCGFISPNYFSVGMKFFSESKSKNSCLNKKISIDKNGLIKNCPSRNNDFGNISDTTLRSVVDNEDFKSIWNISKDQIEVCKDCEFRYICSDCRVYIEDESDLLSKPEKCNYDPYSGVWK